MLFIKLLLIPVFAAGAAVFLAFGVWAGIHLEAMPTWFLSLHYAIGIALLVSTVLFIKSVEVRS